MWTWRWSCIFVFILFLSATHLAAENGNTPLTIVVSNFDFSTFMEEDMIEYVDYLAFQIGKIVDADYVSTFSDLDVEVVREYGKFQVRARDGKDRPSYKYIIDGVLKRPEHGYAVVIRVTEAGLGSRKETFEYAFRSENELYSGCTEIAIDVADWIFGNQENEDDSYDSLVTVGIKTELGWISATSTTAKGCCLTLLLTTMVESPWVIPLIGVDFLWSKNIKENTESYLVGLELNVNMIFVSAGLSIVWESTPDEQIPYLGFRFRLLDIPPLFIFGIDFLPFTVRWNLKTGKPIYTLGIISLTLGVSNLL
jgi:hypothetical protein